MCCQLWLRQLWLRLQLVQRGAWLNKHAGSEDVTTHQRLTSVLMPIQNRYGPLVHTVGLGLRGSAASKLMDCRET